MQERPVSDLAEIFAAEALVDEPGGRYNIAPTDEAIVVVERDDRRALKGYRWGLIPHWAPDARIASRTFNARAESIASMPAFRESFQRRRCLVPVDAFYEWKREDGSASRTGSSGRTGDRCACRPVGRLEEPGDHEVRRTFTIVTTTPNAVVAELHNRMPVIVPDEAWARWLDPRTTDLGELRALLEPSDEVALEIAPASRLVNDVRNDGPQLLLALD